MLNRILFSRALAVLPLLAVALLPPLPAAAAAHDGAGEPYAAWFTLFKQKLDGCGVSIDANEKLELDELLSIQPADGTCRRFEPWFGELFVPTLGKLGVTVDPDVALRMDFVLKAKPDLKGQEAYDAWLALYRKNKECFGSSTDANERYVLDCILAAKPDPAEEEDGPVHAVRESTLVRIRQAVQENRARDALRELDLILEPR